MFGRPDCLCLNIHSRSTNDRVSLYPDELRHILPTTCPNKTGLCTRALKKIHIVILTLFCYKLVCKMASFCLLIQLFLLVSFDIFTLNLALRFKNVEVGEIVNEFRKIKQRQSL